MSLCSVCIICICISYLNHFKISEYKKGSELWFYAAFSANTVRGLEQLCRRRGWDSWNTSVWKRGGTGEISLKCTNYSWEQRRNKTPNFSDSIVCRTRVTEHKWNAWYSSWQQENTFLFSFSVRVTEHWNKLPKKVV